MRPDRLLLSAVLLLILVGLLSLYAAAFNPVEAQLSSGAESFLANPFGKQFLWIGLGLALLFSASRIDYRRLYSSAWRFYILGLLLLIGTLAFGSMIRNVRSWIVLGPISLQPSEFVKICLVIVLARLFASEDCRKHPLLFLSLGGVLTGLMAGLVILQPDMGTAILYLSLLLTIPFAARIPVKYSVWILSAGFLAAVHVLLFIGQSRLGWAADSIVLSPFIREPAFSVRVWGGGFIGVMILLFAARRRLPFEEKINSAATYLIGAGAWLGAFGLLDFIKPYQQQRLITFLSPSLDARGAGYNVIQSTIAVGSGRLWGKGLLSASQSHLGFLPEHQTDFIFSVVGETFGFAGGAFVILAYLTIVLSLLLIALQSDDLFGALLCVGAATFTMAHGVVNIGMCLGIMPIMGIPLPLLSQGGSSAVSFLIMMGLALSVYRQRGKRF